PIVFLRVRKAWFNNGTKVIVAHDQPTDADSFADAVLRYKKGTASTLAKGIADLLKGDGDANAIASATGVDKDALHRATQALREDSATVTTHALLDQPTGRDAVAALRYMPSFNCYALGANDQ